MNDSPKPRSVRWSWAAGILVIGAVGLMFVWRREGSRQDHNIGSMVVALLTAALLFVWAILFSRFSKRLRAAIFTSGVVGGIALANFVEISGVTGDLIPIFRFKRSKAQTAEKPKASSAKPIAKEGASFPQFLGPARNGIVEGARLETNWTAHPPQEMWRRPVGPAWSGLVVADGICITQEQRDDQELVTAYDLQSGNLLWSHGDTARYKTTIAGEGPRATPTIANSRVYSFGATGVLNCLDLASGNVVWSKNIASEHSAPVPEWGFASAPLIYDGKVIVNAGGKNSRSLVAHDATNGNFVWGGGDASAGYSSPTVMELGGGKHVVTFNHSAVAGHDPATGKVLWSHPWPTGTPHCTMPIQIGANGVFASQGYGVGSELIDVAQTNGGWRAERVWKSNRLKSKFANLIFHNGLVYGLDDGIFSCFDPQAGQRKWAGERHGHGQMLLLGDVILLMAENGEVLLMAPSPEEERIVAQFRVLSSKTWNPPALAGEYLLVRNDQEAACFKVALAPKANSAQAAAKL